MIEMKIMGIAIDTASGSPIIVLNDRDNRKALPIWIGSAEASAIIRKIENIKVLRPMTHDLIIDILKKTNCRVDRIEINDVEKDTYYATIYLINSDEEEIEIDARPSDAIAVAIRSDSPIFVSAKVLADGAVSCDTEKDEAELQEFRNFIQSVKPSDFEKLLKDDKHMDQ
ncbi:MAG: bifunctional nuclease family protein [Candidatus Gastranaerophilales bacterium]|nr:bifunctional nuclease family protein [Candidatus Gastranaerophilales bacterium]